jgi:hypothetical protein
LVKLSKIAAGVEACKYFSDKGVKTNLTLVLLVDPLSSITRLLKHTLTDSGVAQFLVDYQKGN